MSYLSRYQASEAMLERALKTIPLGAQTFSKSKTQFPHGVSPYFITHGKGCRVWDVDGNEYTDFINGLSSITLGYQDPDVQEAVKAQTDRGVIFSLSHPIEIEVAEKIKSLVPCAEMVRFGKNASDVTAGAIRLARAYTNRDRVAVCGYHGWQDWYIGSTARNRGVPQAVRDLTHTFKFNQIESLHTLFRDYPGQFAAVVLEPMNIEFPQKGFLEEVSEITRKNGALLVFDETITGFRFANGGAQELFGVVPDLAAFGKGLANGYPVSAIAGKAEYMQLMEEIFFSFTFGGEAISLAAALATLTKLTREPVVKNLHQLGQVLSDGVRKRIETHGLLDCMSISGHPAWTFLSFKDVGPINSWAIKTLFLQEVFQRGFLTFGTHNISYAHKDADIGALLKCYDEVFPLLATALRSGKFSNFLRCKPLEPLFKVR